MQNIKLFTFHNAHNYGAMLQAYALKNTLKSLDTNPSFVNYVNKHIIKDYKLIKTNSLKSFFSSLWYLPRNIRRKKAFKSFSDRYLDTNAKECYTKAEVINNIHNNDILISGSDQILNMKLTQGIDDIYALNFNNDNLKIIYGASVGNEEVLDNYINEYKEKLAKVDYLSVRERSILDKLKKITDKNVQQVLDPTLLLSKDSWNNLANTSNISLNNKEYILVYTIFESDVIKNIANELSNKTGLKILHFRKYNIFKNELFSLYSTGPETFVNAFKNAKYIITNSFHGVAFSVIFNKEFYSVLPNERGGRIKDLLTILKIENRIINNYSETDLHNTINYDDVNKILESEKIKSIDFLKKGIECQKNHNY